MMKLAWQCMFSPRLYKIYREGPLEQVYQPNILEKWGDKVINMVNTVLNISYYTSPLICMYVFRRGFFSADESRNFARLFGGVSCLIMFSFIMRGIGRASNPKYTTFLRTLVSSGPDYKANINNIRKYDFEFYAWPVTYTVSEKQKSTSWLRQHPFRSCANTDLPSYQQKSLQILAFLATHTFGLRLIYPGSLSITHSILWNALLHSRTNLVESFDGKRAKIKTAEGNFIDTMFVDNRNLSVKGRTLVICSEGNSGFYEIGIMSTPIKAGYSSLGWNHPGFAESTGTPYPSEEQNGIDAVIQYAINELGFKPEDIAMFGWSIGGYAATWAATQYPVKALILDATFDDLLPLAQNHMPASWRLLVKEVVRSYVDLNIVELIADYSGPVHLIRRTEDEVICMRPGLVSTNRANTLVQRLIEFRHPETFAAASDSPISPLDKYVALLDTQRAVLERSDINETDRKALQLINRYMRDYKSTHCTPLPEQLFDSIMRSIITK